MKTMEECVRADDRVMQLSYTAEVCISSVLFCHGIDGHCHTCVDCALMEAQLEQGKHLTQACRNWKPVDYVETGHAVAS